MDVPERNEVKSISKSIAFIYLAYLTEAQHANYLFRITLIGERSNKFDSRTSYKFGIVKF